MNLIDNWIKTIIWGLSLLVFSSTVLRPLSSQRCIFPQVRRRTVEQWSNDGRTRVKWAVFGDKPKHRYTKVCRRIKINLNLLLIKILEDRSGQMWTKPDICGHFLRKMWFVLFKWLYYNYLIVLNCFDWINNILDKNDKIRLSVNCLKYKIEKSFSFIWTIIIDYSRKCVIWENRIVYIWLFELTWLEN